MSSSLIRSSMPAVLLVMVMVMVMVGVAGSPAWAGEPPVTAIINGTAHQALFAVSLDGARGTAVGAAGQILLTEDGGANWHPSKQDGVTSLSLLGVEVRGSEQIVVGQAGTIFVSDGQDTWRQVGGVTKERLFAVATNDLGCAVAVGAFGTIVRSNDRGGTWTSVAPADIAQYSDQGADPHLYAVSVDEKGTITVAGEFGLILRSQDCGAHWTVAHKGAASLFGLELSKDGSGYAVGQSGTILRTADGGASWVELKSNSEANLLGVSADGHGRVLVTAMNSVLESADGGMTWAPVSWGDFGSAWYSGVQFVAGESSPAVLVGHAGRILRINP